MGDYFSWSTRTDREGKAAGIYSATPFPVTESTSTYSIKNDENPSGKTYNTGTIYFVDGNGVENGNAQYNPATRTTGGGAYTVYSTIPNALSALGGGNITVLVRAGTYTENSQITWESEDGTDDTHRFAIIGYNQERPIIDASGNGSISFKADGADYITLQRIRIQGAGGRAFYSSRGQYINLIDVDFYNNSADGDEDGTVHIKGYDGTNAESTWIFHCTVKHTYNKGLKICDNADNTIVEWCDIDECGYWEGIDSGFAWGGNNYGVDFAADSTTDNNSNLILRYNIIGYAHRGNELRYCPNFSIHHNEFHHSIQQDYFSDDAGWDHNSLLQIRGSSSYGVIYGNLIRNNPDSRRPYLLTTVGMSNDTNYIQVYNNILYAAGKPVFCYSFQDQAQIRFYNNSIYSSNTDYLVGASKSLDSNETIDFENNIFYQVGSGACLDVDSSATHSYNQFYNPSGSRGVVLGTGDQDGDPLWNEIPSGTFNTSLCKPVSGSPTVNKGTDLSGTFTVDFGGTTRPVGSAWDIGAYEYEADSSKIIMVLK